MHPQTLGEWFRQRSRQLPPHPTTRKHQWLLAVFGGLHLMIYFLLLLSTVCGALQVKEALVCWMIMVGLMSLVQYPVFRKLGSIKALLWTPVTDIFLAGFLSDGSHPFQNKKSTNMEIIQAYFGQPVKNNKHGNFNNCRTFMQNGIHKSTSFPERTLKTYICTTCSIPWPLPNTYNLNPAPISWIWARRWLSGIPLPFFFQNVVFTGWFNW